MGEYKNVLFKDSFIGTAGYPPDRGKWFAFLTRENSSVDFTDGTIEPTVNGCRFAAAVDSSGWGSLNLMSRAEFREPFKTRVAINPRAFGFSFSLTSPVVGAGNFLGRDRSPDSARSLRRREKLTALVIEENRGNRGLPGAARQVLRVIGG